MEPIHVQITQCLVSFLHLLSTKSRVDTTCVRLCVLDNDVGDPMIYTTHVGLDMLLRSRNSEIEDVRVTTGVYCRRILVLNLSPSTHLGH